jgi:hypothetical protein
MTYGGNEEIVLKDKRARKLQKQEKTEIQSQRMYMQRSSGILLPEDSYRSRMGVCCCS